MSWLGGHWDTAGAVSLILGALAWLIRQLRRKSPDDQRGLMATITRIISNELRAALAEQKAAAWEADSQRKDDRIARLLAELVECRAAASSVASSEASPVGPSENRATIPT